jgi:hypothetical protein
MTSKWDPFEWWSQTLRLVRAADDTQLPELASLVGQPGAKEILGTPARNGDTLLIVAACSGTVECAKTLASVCDARVCGQDGRTALMWAAIRGNAGLVEALLPHSDASQRCHDRKTALIWAAELGRLAAMKSLLPASDANASDIALSALGRAAESGHEDCARVLLPATTRERARIDAAVRALAAGKGALADEIALTLSQEKAASLLRAVERQDMSALPQTRAKIERAQLLKEADNGQGRRAGADGASERDGALNADALAPRYPLRV